MFPHNAILTRSLTLLIGGYIHSFNDLLMPHPLNHGIANVAQSSMPGVDICGFIVRTFSEFLHQPCDNITVTFPMADGVTRELVHVTTSHG